MTVDVMSNAVDYFDKATLKTRNLLKTMCLVDCQKA